MAPRVSRSSIAGRSSSTRWSDRESARTADCRNARVRRDCSGAMTEVRRAERMWSPGKRRPRRSASPSAANATECGERVDHGVKRRAGHGRPPGEVAERQDMDGVVGVNEERRGKPRAGHRRGAVADLRDETAARATDRRKAPAASTDSSPSPVIGRRVPSGGNSTRPGPHRGSAVRQRAALDAYHRSDPLGRSAPGRNVSASRLPTSFRESEQHALFSKAAGRARRAGVVGGRRFLRYAGWCSGRARRARRQSVQRPQSLP